MKKNSNPLAFNTKIDDVVIMGYAYIDENDNIHYNQCQCDDLDYILTNGAHIREALDKKVREENDSE